MAQLKAFVVQRDKDLNIQSENIIGKFAVVTDEQTDSTEVIRINVVDIEGILWSREKGILHLELSLGGLDKAGKYHRHLKHQSALVSWGRDRNPDLWAKYGLEDIDTVKLDDIKQWMHDEDCVIRAGRDIWGLPGLESKVGNGEYKTQAKAAVPVLPPLMP